MQQFFDEAFTLTTDPADKPPPLTEALMNQMMTAAARNGMEWIKPA